MGQYWMPVNLDKKEYLHPHDMGDGAKLWEQAFSAGGVASALVLLLAPLPIRRGGGDPSDLTHVGRWAGDRIVFVGDYSEKDDCKVRSFGTLYKRVRENKGYTNISDLAKAMVDSNNS